jgi:hypothetical protein
MDTHNGITIYAAGPIDLGKDIPNWRAQLAVRLNERHVSATIFDPSTAYKNSVGPLLPDRCSAYIEHVNRAALDVANLMVVVLPTGVQSIGTPIELEFARNESIETYLLTDIPRGKSVYLNNRIDDRHWLSVVDLHDPSGFDYILSMLADYIANPKTSK